MLKLRLEGLQALGPFWSEIVYVLPTGFAYCNRAEFCKSWNLIVSDNGRNFSIFPANLGRFVARREPCFIVLKT